MQIDGILCRARLMALTEEELSILRDHLAATATALPPCAVCQRIEWKAIGIVEVDVQPLMIRQKFGASKSLDILQALSRTAGGSKKREVIPHVVVTCGNCFHTIQFNWAAIVHRHRAENEELRSPSPAPRGPYR